MSILTEVIELENRGYSQNGEPVLIDAYRILRNHWRAGDRDRELALHLLFLSWYGLVEPPFVFGEYDAEVERLQETFTEVFEYFEPQIDGDAELLFAVGLPAHMFPYLLGDEATWEARALEYQAKYRHLQPDGINPEIFRNRGAYGQYYEHQAKVVGGF